MVFERREDYEIFDSSFQRPKIRFEVSSKLLDIASSAIDISDGLFQDLDHICKASKVGAVICLEKIPTFLSNSLTIDEINRGDDYEILFTSDKSKSRRHPSILQ